MKTSIIVSWVLPISVMASDVECTEGNTLFQSSVVSSAVIEDNGAALIEDNGAAELDIKDDSESEAVAAGTRRLVPQQCDPHEAAKELGSGGAGHPMQRRHKVLINEEAFIDRSLEEILNEHDEDVNRCKRLHPDGGSGWTWETWHGLPYTTQSNPPIKVCGNSIKISLFPDHGCRHPAVTIGSCDAHNSPPSTCCEYNPSDLKKRGFVPLSYMIESCGPYARLLQTPDPAADNQEPVEVAHPLSLSQMVQPHSQSLESIKVRDESMLAQTSQEQAKLDDNQRVFVYDQPVLGAGAGEGALGKCRELAPQHVGNPDAGFVKVCGQHIKAMFYLRGRCENYYEHSRQIGRCNTDLAPEDCESFGPNNDPRFASYQSYVIQQCAPR